MNPVDIFDLIIVDDEKAIREGLASFKWGPLGFNVKNCFSNGKNALDYLKKENVDVVLSDIRMPYLDGLDLAEWVKQNKPETRLILISGYKDFEYARKALSSCVFYYLLKPVDIHELEETMIRARGILLKERYEKNSLNQLKEVHSAIEYSKTSSGISVKLAIQYINQNYREPISLQIVANVIGISPSYLSSQFKAVTGRNFLEYLRNLRVSCATDLLIKTNLKIFEISLQVGYENTKYFSDIFKHATGQTPLGFRRTHFED